LKVKGIFTNFIAIKNRHWADTNR